jgi:glyoxylase-like metal-dependent hydrolase (beta-lactamase superfamily II)
MQIKLLRHIAVLKALIGITLMTALVGCSAVTEGNTPMTPMPAAITELPTGAVYTPVNFIIDEDLSIRQISESVYIIMHAFPWPANSMVVEMVDGTLVLVDTPYTPEATEAVLDWFEIRLGERSIVAINTGYHCENLGGNGYLIERGIPVYGSNRTADLLLERGDELRSLTLDWLQGDEYRRFYEVHADLDLVPPTRIFSAELGLELEFGGQMVMAYYPGPTYAPDNLVVYFPFQRVLFGGCMIVGGDQLGSTSEADLLAWRESLQKLYQFEFDILVPGHGERLDPGLLEHTLTLLPPSPE